MRKPWVVGIIVLVLTVLVHAGYYYVVRPQAPCGTAPGQMWKATEPRPPSISATCAITRRYFGNRLYLMGLSYGLALGFTAYAGLTTRRVPKRGTAGVVGGLTLTGVLATLGCFLLGCCGSPMLAVYAALFGSSLVGFQDVVVFLVTALSVLGGFFWLRRCGTGAAACCGPDCDCHASAAPAEWRVDPGDGNRPPADDAPMGWINASVTLDAAGPTDWAPFVRSYATLLHAALQARDAEVLHLKMLLTTPAGSLVVAFARTTGALTFQGDPGPPTLNASLIVNTRARLAPEHLQKAIEDALAKTANGVCQTQIVQMQSLRPSPPQSTPDLGGQAEAPRPDGGGGTGRPG